MFHSSAVVWYMTHAFFKMYFQVYLPCVLQTKKRYVGYMYETLEQKEPVFDAKGIETVRRDSCPAVAKVCLFLGRIIHAIRKLAESISFFHPL